MSRRRGFSAAQNPNADQVLQEPTKFPPIYDVYQNAGTPTQNAKRAESGRASTGDLYNKQGGAADLPPRYGENEYDQPTTVSDYPGNAPQSNAIRIEPQIGQGSTLDYLRQKVRELEISLIDVKGTTDRRLNSVNETLLGRLDRDNRNIDQKVRSNGTETNSNFQIASEQFQSLKGTVNA